MLNVIVVISEPARLKPMNWYIFNLPELPRPGDYLSIGGPDIRAPLSQDLIVRHVWWRLIHPAAGAPAEEETRGHVQEIFVECDIAEGPYSSETWRAEIAFARARGLTVERFNVSRLAVS